MKKAIIFDVDGVLLDSVPYHYEAWRRMFEEYGITINQQDYLLKLNGLPRDTGIANIATEASAELRTEMADRKQSLFVSNVEENPLEPLDGVIELLTTLRKSDYLLSAASSSKNAPRLLTIAGIHTHLDDMIGGSDFRNPKPAPDIFLTAAKRLEVEPSACIVIEDAAIGVQAAQHAGMKAIGLTRSNDDNIAQQADFVTESLSNIREILEYIKQS